MCASRILPTNLFPFGLLCVCVCSTLRGIYVSACVSCGSEVLILMSLSSLQHTRNQAGSSIFEPRQEVDQTQALQNIYGLASAHNGVLSFKVLANFIIARSYLELVFAVENLALLHLVGHLVKIADFSVFSYKGAKDLLTFDFSFETNVVKFI